MRRRLLASLCALIVAVMAGSSQSWAQTAPIPRAAGVLVPFWLMRPAYHEIARMARVTGVVVVALTVAPDGRVQSATIERDVPVLSNGVLALARSSGFICRGCTGPMTYRLEYHFRLLDTTEEIDRARAFITSDSAMLPVIASSPIVDHAASAPRPNSGRPLEHAEQEP
jgi:TonB family protein